MSAIEVVEKSQLTERPDMKSGDTVRVHVKVREGDKERIQIFEGIVIGMHRGACARHSPCGRSPSVRASSASSRCTRRRSPRWMSCGQRVYDARSCTSCAI